MDYVTRPAHLNEYDRLGDIEQSAGRRFIGIGLAQIADDEPADPEFIGAVGAYGAVLIAAQADDDTPVGFALVGILDRAAHIYEISVAEEHGRRGLGSRLIEHAVGFARTEGLSAVTLSTFRDVAWNGPLYERLGFRYIKRGEWTPALYLLRDLEMRRSLPVERRAFMRRDIA